MISSESSLDSVNVLSLDPANSCGWCILRIVENKGYLIDCGFIDIPKMDYSGDQSLFLQSEVRKLITQYFIQYVAIEDYMFSRSKCSGSHINVYYRGALHMLAREYKIPYTILSVSNWKSIVVGRSMPTKEMKKFYGKERANKIMVQEALWVRYNIRFPNHSISPKTKKPIALRYDMIDATAIGIAFLYSEFNIKNIENQIVFPADVTRKSNVKEYVYETNA